MQLYINGTKQTGQILTINDCIDATFNDVVKIIKGNTIFLKFQYPTTLQVNIIASNNENYTIREVLLKENNEDIYYCGEEQDFSNTQQILIKNKVIGIVINANNTTNDLTANVLFN